MRRIGSALALAALLSLTSLPAHAQSDSMNKQGDTMNMQKKDAMAKDKMVAKKKKKTAKMKSHSGGQMQGKPENKM